jgi:hypothetical protein
MAGRITPVTASRRVFFSAALAVLAAVVAVVLPVTIASAASAPAAGTRVGAHDSGMIFTVGASARVCAGEGRDDAVSQAGFASGACVAAEDDEVAGSTPTGQRGSPMDVVRGTNAPTEINGISYGGHAIDEMQSEGFMPSVVQDAIQNGEESVGASGRVAFYSQANNITVIMEDGRVVTVSSGMLKIR